MKQVAFFFIAFVVSTGILHAQEKTNNTQTVRFTLTITNLKSATSNIYVGFYGPENKFPKQGQHQFAKVIQPNGSLNDVSVTWDDIPAGEFAIAVYQDVNDNQKLETNMFGLPKEPYGFSTNYKAGMFSIPKFKKCKVTIDAQNNSQTIKLIN